MQVSRSGSPPAFSEASLDERSIYLRRLAIVALEGGGRGHIGSNFHLSNHRVLYDDILSYPLTSLTGQIGLLYSE